jgi:hypothetical protein
MKSYTGPWIYLDYLEQPKKLEMDMRYGTFNVKRLCRFG